MGPSHQPLLAVLRRSAVAASSSSPSSSCVAGARWLPSLRPTAAAASRRALSSVPTSAARRQPASAATTSSLVRQLSYLRPLRFPSASALDADLSSSSSLPPPSPSPKAEGRSRSGPPPLSSPNVARWLYFTSFLTFSIVVIGGLTRLTESGLSITEWRPVKGSLPPLNAAQWEDEYRKYQESEEGRIMNAAITLDDFKFIFFMEWAHRNLGRLLGITFVVPALWFAARGKMSRKDQWKAFGLACGIGFQGFLGWYMVSSGLDADHLAARPNSTPRVSQYRLAAHLGAAFVLYLGMLHSALTISRDWAYAHGKTVNGVKVGGAAELDAMLVRGGTRLARFRTGVWAVGALVLLTALSGAFVAGLDAGMIYNEWPTMGEGYVPPTAELMDPAYARRADKSDTWWRNVLENPTTVQFDHRMLAYTTATSVFVLTSVCHSPLLRKLVTPRVGKLASLASAAVCLQALLGITTLLYVVPTPLAACHQAGSVLLLTAMAALATSVRRPSAAARQVRAARTLAAAAPKV